MQNPLTMIVKVKPGEADALDRLLREIGDDIEDNPHIDFTKLATTHFARWVVFDRDTPQPLLLFTSNHDGTWQDYIDWLVDAAGPAIDAIWGKCEGYPGGRAENLARFKALFKAYIAQNSYETAAYFVAYPNQTVKSVRNYRCVREKIEAVLNSPPVDPLLAALKTLPIQPEKEHRTFLSVLGSILSLPIRLLLDLIAPLALTLISAGTPPPNPNEPSEQVNVPLALTERTIVQNELTVISRIDPARLGRLRLALKAVGFLVIHFGNGTLSNIATIHFARWVIFDNGKRLLFESNYDGTWEQYIGDFVDKSAQGLDLIWNNCYEYPKQGARDIQRFKKAIMDHQVRAQTFYSAYPDQSVKNVRNDIAICQPLERLLGRKDVNEWLRRF